MHIGLCISILKCTEIIFKHRRNVFSEYWETARTVRQAGTRCRQEPVAAKTAKFSPCSVSLLALSSLDTTMPDLHQWTLAAVPQAVLKIISYWPLPHSPRIRNLCLTNWLAVFRVCAHICLQRDRERDYLSLWLLQWEVESSPDLGTFSQIGTIHQESISCSLPFWRSSIYACTFSP